MRPSACSWPAPQPAAAAAVAADDAVAGDTCSCGRCKQPSHKAASSKIMQPCTFQPPLPHPDGLLASSLPHRPRTLPPLTSPPISSIKPDAFPQVLHVLLACADPQHQQHKAALTELNQCRAIPTFAPCAAAVFAGLHSAAQAPANIRELAGIELKNAMKAHRVTCRVTCRVTDLTSLPPPPLSTPQSPERVAQLPADALQFVHASAEAMLSNAQHALRRTSASIICR